MSLTNKAKLVDSVQKGNRLKGEGKNTASYQGKRRRASSLSCCQGDA